MKALRYLLPGMAAVATLAGCATGANVTASADEPHAVVSKSVGAMARSIYSVNILKIGPDKTFGDRKDFRVKPGEYVLRISPDIEAMAKNENVRLSANNRPKLSELVRDLQVTLADGNRYYIGARFEGPTLYDWQPVVVRVESLAGLDRRSN